MNKIRVLEVVNQLDLGGTEYALQLFAKFLDKEYFDVTVISLINGGERVQLLEDLGIKVAVLYGDFSKLAAYLEETDVLHWHGGGSLESELFQVLRTSKPSLVIQTNVFGVYAPSPLYSLIDFDLYISKMILIRRMTLDSTLPDNFNQKRKVLPYPVDVDHINSLLPSDEEVNDFKNQFGLNDNFIVGRIGRADNHKFDLITLTGFAKFATQVNRTKFLLAGATDEMISHAKSLGISDKLVIIENTVDFRRLLIYYRAMDVFLAASQIGESFGMVIAEAMAVGTPVLTISTEGKDNAQIELVDNEQSGIVVKRSKTSIAKALKYLYKHPSIRFMLSENSKLKIARDYKAQNIVKSLERLILAHFDLPVKRYTHDNLLESYSKVMIRDYRRRCKDLFGPFKNLNLALLKLKEILPHNK
jgi:glycosyltransferase involved in cell wall biosynthesis